jgi:hypothetical protein
LSKKKLSRYSKFIKTTIYCTTKNAAAYSKKYIQINDSLQSGAKKIGKIHPVLSMKQMK